MALVHLAKQILNDPHTQMAVTGGAIVNYMVNPEHWVFILTVTLLALQVGLALVNWYGVLKKWWAKKHGTKD